MDGSREAAAVYGLREGIFEREKCPGAEAPVEKSSGQAEVHPEKEPEKPEEVQEETEKKEETRRPAGEGRKKPGQLWRLCRGQWKCRPPRPVDPPGSLSLWRPVPRAGVDVWIEWSS